MFICLPLSPFICFPLSPSSRCLPVWMPGSFVSLCLPSFTLVVPSLGSLGGRVHLSPFVSLDLSPLPAWMLGAALWVTIRPPEGGQRQRHPSWETTRENGRERETNESRLGDNGRQMNPSTEIPVPGTSTMGDKQIRPPSHTPSPLPRRVGADNLSMRRPQQRKPRPPPGPGRNQTRREAGTDDETPRRAERALALAHSRLCGTRRAGLRSNNSQCVSASSRQPAEPLSLNKARFLRQPSKSRELASASQTAVCEVWSSGMSCDA